MRPPLIIVLLALLMAGCASCDSARRPAEQADKIVVVKSAHTLTLMSGDRSLRTYNVALGRSPVGPKLRKGDHKTPEGEYAIDLKREHSRFYRALHV